MCSLGGTAPVDLRGAAHLKHKDSDSPSLGGCNGSGEHVAGDLLTFFSNQCQAFKSRRQK